MECFFALYVLQEDGTFRAGDGMTQVFAQLFYLIRSTILYQADFWRASGKWKPWHGPVADMVMCLPQLRQFLSM